MAGEEIQKGRSTEQVRDPLILGHVGEAPDAAFACADDMREVEKIV